MDAPLSGKQKREHMKFLFDELRKNVALRKDQRRKDALAKQQMNHKEQIHQAKIAEMDVPPMMGKPTNPEAGPNDTIPALLAPGEAVIPAKAAQKPENKPLIKALVREGRSDKNLSVPKPKGMECGTTNMKGYEWGSPEVAPDDVGLHNAELSDSEGYGVLQGFEKGSWYIGTPDWMQEKDNTVPLDSQNDVMGGNTNYSVSTSSVPPLEEKLVPIDEMPSNYDIGSGQEDTSSIDINGQEKTRDPVGQAVLAPFRAIKNVFSPPPPLQKFTTNVVGNEEATKKAIQTKDDFNNVILPSVFKIEGGYVEDDAGAGPTNHGINYNANKDVLKQFDINKPSDIKKLTKEQAALIYKNKYYDKVTNDDMDLQTKHALTDAAVNMGPDTAKILWEKSGKDLDKFTDLRNERYKAIAEAKPEKRKFLQGWLARSESFRPLKEIEAPPANPNEPAPETEVPPIYKDEQGTYYKDKFVSADGKEIPYSTREQDQAIASGEMKINEEGKAVPTTGFDKWSNYLTTGAKNIANSIIDTATDPNKAVSALGSFFKDTLGVTGSDAAKFAALYYGQRAMGLRKKGSIEFAGRNVLNQMDQRQAREDAHRIQMEKEGWKYDKETKQFTPGDWRKGTESKSVTFQDGWLSGTNANLIKQTQGGTKSERFVTRGGFTLDQLDYMNKTGKFVDGTVLTPTDMDNIRKLVGGSVYTTTGEGQTEEHKAKVRSEYVEKLSKDLDKVYTNAFGAGHEKLKGNSKYKDVAEPRTAADQFVKAAGKLGLDSSKYADQEVYNTIINNAMEEYKQDLHRIGEGNSPYGKINNVESYIHKQYITAKTQLPLDMFKKSDGEIMSPAQITEQFNSVKNKLKEQNPKSKDDELTQLTIQRYQQLRNEFKADQAKNNNRWKDGRDKSAFSLFINDKYKQ